MSSIYTKKIIRTLRFESGSSLSVPQATRFAWDNGEDQEEHRHFASRREAIPACEL